MELRVQPKKICLQLIVLTCLIYICTSQRCSASFQCPSYAECSFIGKCTCKYGTSYYYPSGNLQPCHDHCTYDIDCVAYADCHWSSSPGNRCQCRYSGSSYIGDDAVSCDAPTGIIVGSIIGGIAFVAIVISCCCCIRRRRRLARANEVTVCVQPTPNVQHVPVPQHTYQPVYPVQQYQQTAPPYPGYNNAGYGACQPPPYSEVASK